MIRVENLSKTFATGVQALGSVSLEIGPREFIAILGPSGCGKSTLLKIFAGLLQADDPQAVAASERRTAFVFQDPTLLPWRTVHRNLQLAFELGRPEGRLPPPMAEIDQMLARVGLESFADHLPAALSGGMKMRASLARALLAKPELLLLDEPFAALDEVIREDLDVELRRHFLAGELTAIFVTHSISEAIFLADRVIVLSPRPGTVVADLRFRFPEDRDTSFRTDLLYREAVEQVQSIFRTNGGAREALSDAESAP